LIYHYISLGIDWDYSNEMWIIVKESEPLWVESKYVKHHTPKLQKGLKIA
jgi:hypothetical protein